MTLKEIAALSNARVIHENGHLDKVIRHALAKECNIAILQSKQSMFKVCGLLYEAGLEPIY